MVCFRTRIGFGLALATARLAQVTGLDWLARRLGLINLLPARLKQLHGMLPRFRYFSQRLPEFLPAHGKRRARVALFTGCVGDVIFRDTNWATARVLQANGCEVIVPRGQVCCGAIHYHAGSEGPARGFMAQNCRALNPADFDALIVNVAGCGSMLKDYGHHWHDPQQAARQRFGSRVKDVLEFLDELGGEIPSSIVFPLRRQVVPRAPPVTVSAARGPRRERSSCRPHGASSRR